MPAEPKYRRPLNTKQLTILRLLFRFRFATSQLLGQTLSIPQRKAHERLQVLLAQGYITRKDEKGFRQPGKFAIYYLTAAGVDALTDLPLHPRITALKYLITRDGTRSGRFINHCLGVFEIYCQLSEEYGDRIRLFTASDLRPYEYFPNPLSNIYIRLDKDGDERQYFLEYIDGPTPFLASKLDSQYVEYDDDGTWRSTTKTPMPQVVLVTDNPNMQKQLVSYLRLKLDDEYPFVFSTKGEVRSALEPNQKSSTR
jgi:hypothetical protein